MSELFWPFSLCPTVILVCREDGDTMRYVCAYEHGILEVKGWTSEVVLYEHGLQSILDRRSSRGIGAMALRAMFLNSLILQCITCG